MITFSNIKRYFSSPLDTAPWTYLFYDANNTGCVSFSNPSGTTNANHVSTDVIFTNSVCITEADVRLRVEGINGCVRTVTISFDDECGDFTVTGINATGFNFSVDAAGGTPSYVYEWGWNTNVLELVSSDPNSPYVSFLPKPQYVTVLGATAEVVLPDSTTLTCKVSDSNGCSETLIYEHYICKPTVVDTIHSLYCLEGVPPKNDYIPIDIRPCSGADIDWTTFKFVLSPSQFTVSHLFSAGVSGAEENIISVAANSTSIVAGNYEVKYRVRDTNGVISPVGTITIVVPACPEYTQGIVVGDDTFQMESGQIVGDTIEIDISNKVIASNPIDWTSFVLLKSGTAQAATLLAEDNLYDDITTPNITYSANARTIYYEIPDTGYTDSFEWAIYDEDGICPSNVCTYTILLETPVAPTATADTACTVCEQPVTIDVLANDSANGRILNPCSLTIVSGPTNGIAVITSAYEVLYTPHTGFEGVDTFTYTVSNNDSTPVTSSAATVTITVLCSGEPTNINVCN